MVDHALGVRTPGLAELSLAMACTAAQAAPLAAVAVREVEECAVRLTGRRPARSGALRDPRVRAAALRLVDPGRRNAC